jgi:AraC family L-rhamnose operon regulatory protein RhaS
MAAVKNEQKRSLVFEQSHYRYTIDTCLPQRQAIDSGKVGFHALSHGHYPGRKIDPSLLPGVPSLGYFDVIGAQYWGIPEHRNEGIEICFQQTGESVLTVDSVPHRMAPNCLSLTRPWQLHRLGDPNLKSGRLFWIILDVGVRRPNQSWSLPPWCVLSSADGKELVKKLRGNENPVWVATPGVGAVFVKIREVLESSAPEARISRLRVYLNELLIELLELLRKENVEEDTTLTTRRRVVEIFLKELKGDPSLLGYPWTLDRMAEQCGMGRTNFSDLCRELVNTSPMETLTRWRLACAAELLRREPDKPITTIALEVGFSTSQYFASKFRKQYGMSPREWRGR